MNSPLLGVDIGLKRTGIALSESGVIAQPLEVIEADPPHMTKVLHALVDRIKHHEIRTVVIGLPLTSDGEMTSQASKVTHLIGLLHAQLKEQNLDVDIEEVNEFYSTIEAASLYPGVEIDAASAALILQEYINEHSSL
jgi:putative transcription antitermination factor YqgF